MLGFTMEEFKEHFRHDRMREGQREGFEYIIGADDPRVLMEMPTGIGKTDQLMTPLKALAARGEGPLFFVTPTKNLVAQAQEEFGEDVAHVLGRSGYTCEYYRERGMPNVTAAKSPCYNLNCGSRINMQTGETQEEEATPCGYYLAKYKAMQSAASGGTITVCTTAFFLMNRMWLKSWREMEPALVAVDEVHALASIARQMFATGITDYHIRRCANMLKPLNKKVARQLKAFLKVFMTVAERYKARERHLIKNDEVEELLEAIGKVDAGEIDQAVRQALANGVMDPVEHIEELRTLTNLTYGIPRLMRSLEFALESEGRRPLNYVVAFYKREDDPDVANHPRRARYRLTIKAYYVRPIIKKVLGEKVIACSATIGKPKILGYETGVGPDDGYEFFSCASRFPIANTRLYQPIDTPDLAKKRRDRKDPKRACDMVVRAASRFAQHGHRSLVVVISEKERRTFMQRAYLEGSLSVVTYRMKMSQGQRRQFRQVTRVWPEDIVDDISPREAVEAFKEGAGEVLVGTAAQFGKGIDLPSGQAPVIFFMRPGYQNPRDPQAQFESRRFSDGHCWALWTWRVCLEALQVRGRNVRSGEDKGVCFFVSQQFSRFLYSGLPEWLKPAHKRGMTINQCVDDALKLFGTEDQDDESEAA